MGSQLTVFWRLRFRSREVIVLRKMGLLVGVIVMLAVSYLLLAPTPIEPVAWQAPTAPGYTGPFAPNDRLTHLSRIPIGDAVGPETIASSTDGKLYTGVDSGDLLRWKLDGSGLEVWANSGGHVFGLTVDGQGQVAAADAIRGLLMIDQTKQVTVVSGSPPLGFVNSVIVAKSGKIYFSEATRRFLVNKWGAYAAMLDVLEHSATGRIHEYDPTTKKIRVVIGDLCFANGVALSSDERSLFIAETCHYRVWKVSVDAANVSAKTPDATQAKVLVDNLPGFPDNIMRGLNGRVWVGLVRQRSRAVDEMSGQPWLRKQVLRLPWNWLLRHHSYAHVFAMDENGSIVFDMQDPSGSTPELTGVTETADRLYFHSLMAHEIYWLDKKGLELR
jgi:sugar lactone lactonase YvrE